MLFAALLENRLDKRVNHLAVVERHKNEPLARSIPQGQRLHKQGIQLVAGRFREA